MVQVTERDRFQYGLELDNYGTRDSGRHRITGSMRWASPFERGDNLDLRLMLAQCGSLCLLAMFAAATL